MRILLNGLPTQVGGGATVWRALAAGASGRASFTLLSRNEAAAAFVSNELDNLDVRLFGASRLGMLEESRIIQAELRSGRYDALVTHNRASLGRFDVPQIALHVNLSRFIGRDGVDIQGRAADLVRDELTKWSLRTSDANLFESQHLLDAARARYPKLRIADPRVVYVGVEQSWTRPVDDPMPEAAFEGRRLLSITSPNPHKDNGRLAMMLRLLLDESPGWRLAIAGGRNMEVWEPLREQARALGVVDKLEFLGFLDRAALARELDDSFALISPSLVESFAMVPLEAMARGLPAVVTDRPAMPESVGDAALVVKAESENDFADALLRLSERAVWQDYSRRGRRRASDLSWTAFADDVLAAIPLSH